MANTKSAIKAARKAHPGFLVEDLGGLTERLDAAGHEVLEDRLLPGVRRAHVSDPFGNRIELIQA